MTKPTLKKYAVYGTVTGGKYLGTVEAENEEQAKDLGWELEECCACLCHQCAKECEEAEVVEINVEEED